METRFWFNFIITETDFIYLRARPLRKKELFYICIYFSPKIVEKFIFCQNPFPAILRRKNKNKKKALVVGPLKKEPFFAASRIQYLLMALSNTEMTKLIHWQLHIELVHKYITRITYQYRVL